VEILARLRDRDPKKVVDEIEALLRDAGIVTKAQFIVGLENETAETLEETYRMACDWEPDMANRAMHAPWPCSDLFQEPGDKVEAFEYEKYNFVTPIMKPDAMDRTELLDRVMNNYHRFFMHKTFFRYPWTRDRTRRRYLMGCLKAFLKSGCKRQFYDLGRVGYWGPQSKKTVAFAFDAALVLAGTAQAVARFAGRGTCARGLADREPALVARAPPLDDLLHVPAAAEADVIVVEAAAIDAGRSHHHDRPVAGHGAATLPGAGKEASSSAAPFQKIWMPMQNSRKAVRRTTMLVPVAPKMRARPAELR
jgi:hypothetical protein